ncbi:MAG: hypothetical protein LBP94_00190 [Zoogloeaceae bacterium]|jgi:colicin import membrane protein|nr:hypothetical protein [Zoogloeaceae bacterium]
MKTPLTLLTLTVFALTAQAQAPDSAITPTGDPDTLKAQAASLREEARDIRAAAEIEHANAQNACWKKFLVSSCLEDAGQAYRDEKLKASRLESRAHAIDRELKRREIAEKDAKRAAEDAARDKLE